jgi:hypothetical protein
MLATVSRPIGSEDTSLDVEHDLAQLGAVALVKVTDQLRPVMRQKRRRTSAATTRTSCRKVTAPRLGGSATVITIRSGGIPAARFAIWKARGACPESRVEESALYICALP